MDEQDTQDAALETDQTEEVVDTEQQADQTDTQHGMTKEQLDFIDQRNASHFGRIVASQIEEKVMPMLQQINQPTPQTSTTEGLDSLNQELQEQIFSGDITGAFERYTNLKANVAKTQSNQKEIATKKAITSLSDRPYYKDVYPEVEKLTQQYLNAGYPPAAAAEMGYEKAKGNHLESQITGGGGGLDMSTGGRRVARKTKVTLPPEFKAAAERDIASGVFKDEADYIANLSPAIQAKYGM